jgi:hypothetical protein
MRNLLHGCNDLPCRKGHRIILAEPDGTRLFALRRLIRTSDFDAIYLFTIKPLLIGGLAARCAILQSCRQDFRNGGRIGRIRGRSGQGWRTMVIFKGLAAGLGVKATAATFENDFDRHYFVSSSICVKTVPKLDPTAPRNHFQQTQP